MYIAGANLFVGSTENESKYLNAKGLLSANLSVDTLNIKYKDEISTNIGGLKMVANTTPVIDTTAVIPMTAGLELIIYAPSCRILPGWWPVRPC